MVVHKLTIHSSNEIDRPGFMPWPLRWWEITILVLMALFITVFSLGTVWIVVWLASWDD